MKKINKRKHPPKEFEQRKAAIYTTQKKIQKERNSNREPAPFNAYEHLTGADRIVLRQALAADQGFICVYCEQKLNLIDEIQVSPKNTVPHKAVQLKKGLKIEHFEPESIFQGRVNTATEAKVLCDKQEKFRADKTLDYQNLFLACSGQSGGASHCDTSKGNHELCAMPNPASWTTTDERKIKFGKNGTIYTNDKQLQTELTGTIKANKSVKPHYLRLNEQKLLELRVKAWKVLARQIARQTGVQNWESGGKEVLKIIKKYQTLYKNGKRVQHLIFYKPFRSFILYNLEKRLRRFNG